MATAKPTSIKGKSLYDIVTTKSKKFVDKMKAPLIKNKMKRAFENQVATIAEEIFDSKAREVELLMNVKEVDTHAILLENKLRKEAFEDMQGIASIYENIFGSELKLEVKEEDLIVSSADILSQAKEIEEEDEE